MKVCHLISYYNSNALYLNLVQCLSNRKISQLLISPRGFTRQKVNHKSVTYYGKNIWNQVDRINFSRKSNKYVNLVLEAIQDQDSVDLIHAHTLYSDGIMAGEVSDRLGIPFIITVRNTDINVFARLGLGLTDRAKQVLKNARFIIFVNHHARADLERHLNVKLNDNKVGLLPNGLDNFWIDNPAIRTPPVPDTIRLVSVGQVNFNKNHYRAIRAVKSHNRAGNGTRMMLTIVGDYSNLFGKCLKKIFESENITFPGLRSQSEIRDIFSKSDVFVLLSLTETFGIVYAEAVSQGLPIIYTSEQGFDGWVKDGTWGFCCKPTDTEQLKRLVLKLAVNWNGSETAIQDVNDMFNWNTITDQLTRIYEQSVL